MAAATKAIATTSTSSNNIKARILAVMHDASLSREQKHCYAQAIYLERMQAQRKKKAPGEDDAGRSERTFRSPGNYGCSHYKRNCRIKAECCQKFFTCRLCHDEECSHKIDRFATKRMMCMFCLTEQDIAAECANQACGKRMAKYFCAKCRLFDDDYEGTIFHCDDCGLCRKAESNKYWHCHKCNTCLTSKKEDHTCLEHVLDQNCPVCNEYLFTSLTPITFPECMHPMHEACMNTYTRTSTRCPICCRSLYHDDYQNIQIEHYLVQNQMPEEYADHNAEILCNDCLVKSVTKFHFVYHKCLRCGKFNTRVLRSGPGIVASAHHYSIESNPSSPSQPSSQSQAFSGSSQTSHPHLQSRTSPPDTAQADVEMDIEGSMPLSSSESSGTSSSSSVVDAQSSLQTDTSSTQQDAEAMEDDSFPGGNLIHSLHSFPIAHAMRGGDTAPPRFHGASFPHSQQSSPLSHMHAIQPHQAPMSTDAADQMQTGAASSDARSSSLHITGRSSGSSSTTTSSSSGHLSDSLSHPPFSGVSHSSSSSSSSSSSQLMFSSGHVAAQAHVAMAHRLRESRPPVAHAHETGAPIM